MNIYETVFINIVFILFPLFCYFLFLIYKKGCGKETKDILFDLALYTSVYLIIKYNYTFSEIEMMLIIIPLLLAYLNYKLFTAILMSITIGLYYYFTLHFDSLIIILEFVSYFLIYLLFYRRKEANNITLNAFIVAKLIFLIFGYYSWSNINFVCIIIFMITFYLVSSFIYYLLRKCEQGSSLYMTLKELEKEKQLRDSLFKITHEIKNPLAVCKGYLDMLDPNNKHHIEKYIPIIKQEVERTLTLMNDFLSLTKLKVELLKIDFSVVLNDIYESLQMLIKANNIAFKPDMFDDEVYILGDYDRLKQVFINLIKNSIEAIPKNKDGWIKIKVKHTKIKLIINIEDNGIGIEADVLKKIGEPFVTTKRWGTGLGIRLSKEIIEAHNGSIEYKSKKGMGTTVIISFPIIKNPC